MYLNEKDAVTITVAIVFLLSGCVTLKKQGASLLREREEVMYLKNEVAILLSPYEVKFLKGPREVRRRRYKYTGRHLGHLELDAKASGIHKTINFSEKKEEYLQKIELLPSDYAFKIYHPFSYDIDSPGWNGGQRQIIIYKYRNDPLYKEFNMKTGHIYVLSLNPGIEERKGCIGNNSLIASKTILDCRIDETNMVKLYFQNEEVSGYKYKLSHSGNTIAVGRYAVEEDKRGGKRFRENLAEDVWKKFKKIEKEMKENGKEQSIKDFFEFGPEAKEEKKQ